MNESEKSRIYKKKLFCCNCGKYGHKYSKCNEPITSLGIIAIKPNEEGIYEKFKNFFNNEKYYNLIKSNTMNNNILLEIDKYRENFKFLLIQRRKTLGYIEFLRGRYNESNYDEIVNLFDQMTKNEINDILTKNFLLLWQDLWKNNIDNKYYKNEYDESFKKFQIVKFKKDLIKSLENIVLDYDSPEWGFPKGRRIYLEKNINCAIREFEEETSLTSKDYILINNIPPIQETFYGTNEVLYRHIYYFALCKSDLTVTLNKDNPNQMEEIGNIGFFSFNECCSLIRNYHVERQNILNETFIFLSSILKYNFKLNNSLFFNTERFNDIYSDELHDDSSINSDNEDNEELEHFVIDP